MNTILGNRGILGTLFGAIKQKKLAGCYIIEGAEGSGKLSIARLVASALTCENPRPDGSPCHQCRSCRNVASMGHIDVVELRLEEDKKQIPVEAVRKALDCTRFRPAEGDWRVFIIENAQALNKSAQNALLKSIEEPAPGNVFFLLTEDIAKLLPTVRSRGVKLRTEPLDRESIEKALIRDGAEAEAAQEAALLSTGSLGKAKELLLDAETRRARQKALQYFSALMDGASFTKLCLIIPPSGTGRGELETLLALIKIGLRDLMGTRFGAVKPEFFSDTEFMRDLASVISPVAASQLFHLTEELEKASGQNANLFSALSGFHLTAMKLARAE